MGKRKVGLAKDTLVYMREQWGEKAGIIDEAHIYRINTIGPKRANVVRVNKDDPSQEISRRFQVALYEKSYSEQNTRVHSDRMFNPGRFFPYTWSMCFVPLGEAGWDPDFNF